MKFQVDREYPPTPAWISICSRESRRLRTQTHANVPDEFNRTITLNHRSNSDKAKSTPSRGWQFARARTVRRRVGGVLVGDFTTCYLSEDSRCTVQHERRRRNVVGLPRAADLDERLQTAAAFALDCLLHRGFHGCPFRLLNRLSWHGFVPDSSAGADLGVGGKSSRDRRENLTATSDSLAR